jgi:TetR/AcrR family transcriptional regulator, regulator of mycofactocin system
LASELTPHVAQSRGRPPSTTPERIAAVALALFAARGFDDTTVDDIAAELGIGRRTVFRYFASKNDIVWGDFDQVLDRLRRDLAALGTDLPMMEAIAQAVISSNRYGPEQLPELRTRMSLITTVPALQAHSMLRYAAWREVIAEYVAARCGEDPSDVIPQTVAHAALGVSMAAFSRWVSRDDEDLERTLHDSWHGLASAFVES